ncbi:MAG: trypsin-like peptidase domain-containing protein [Oscillospiraceae bacterium]|nr:trypsin-like peptidase domain-containing protein [Oscillospiraceae bacterium]
MANFDPNTGAPLVPQKKKGGKIALVIVGVVLLCALGFGFGASIRGFARARIVPKEGGSASVYTIPAPGKDTETPPKAAYTGDELSAAEIYALLTPACVGVSTSTTSTNVFGQITRGAITGSGFIISADGYVLTNNHVIETALAENLEVKVMLFSGEEYTAEIIGGDSRSDVALLKIPGKDFPCVTLGTFSGTRVGEPIYAIGNPLGELTYSMTSGIVSALDRSITISNNTAIDMFQIDAAINNGNSGGPIINRFGQVIGIASAKYASSGVEGLGFAIPIDDALKVVDDLAAYGYVKGRPLLGVVVGNAEAYTTDGTPGAIVMEINRGSCSDKAGILVGDIIVEAGGKTITSVADLLDARRAWHAGDTITIVALRGDETLTFSVTLDEDLPQS